MEERLYIRYLSTGLYKIINDEIGTAEIVRIRRILDNLSSTLSKINSPCRDDHLNSGSRVEGFRFASSDLDTMIIYTDVNVGTGDSHHVNGTEHFRVETDQTRPGFCLLRLVSNVHFSQVDIHQVLVPFRNGVYLSSMFLRDSTMFYIPEGTAHGPCESGIYGHVETDIAHSLKYPGWPKLAYPCLQKLVRIKWPSSQVLSRMLNRGCHLVPIGDKSSDKEVIEWRLSFSEAEKTLIHKMNHCQFLTYGLLKMFLKDVINTKQEVNGLLCSYFLKTVVFWEIANNGINWMEYDFLKWFWICFRRLLSWVSHGYCPNFFIPENNMFFGKIQGRSQQVILHHLTSLYRRGYTCLLGCSFHFEYEFLLRRPTGDFLYCSHRLSTKEFEDLNLIREIYNYLKCKDDISSLNRSMQYLLYLIVKTKTLTELVALNIFLQCRTQHFLYVAAHNLLSSASSSCNRMTYQSIVKFINSLKITKYDVSSHSILSAMILCKSGMYHHAVRKARNILQRIQGPNVLYTWRLNDLQYREFGGEFTPVDDMIKAFIVNFVSLGIDTCLPELYFEHECARKHYCYDIVYSPIILLYFILFLSYFHSSLSSAAEITLHELTLLVNHSDFDKSCSNISWEILGISQEMTGYLDDAYVSYLNAMKEPSYKVFCEATQWRIQNLFEKMNN